MAMDTLMTPDSHGPRQEGVTQAVTVITALEGLLSVTDKDSEVWGHQTTAAADKNPVRDTAAPLDLSPIWPEDRRRP